MLLARSMEELMTKTALHDQLFQIGRADWQLDQDTGLITFTSPRGVVATAPAQIVGTYNTADGTWMWAWANPSVEPKMADHSRLAQADGEKHHLADFTARKYPTTEARCWELTAITCALGGYQGGYRGPAGSARVFVTFGEAYIRGA